MPRKKKVDPNIKKTEEQIKQEEAQALYAKQQKGHREVAHRHVLKLEVDMDEDSKRRTFALANELRIAGNILTSRMEKRLKATIYQKSYITLHEEYTPLKKKMDSEKDEEKKEQMKESLRKIGEQMSAIQKDCNCTWDYCRKQMEQIAVERNLSSIFALSQAEDVWNGVEKVLYGNGTHLHYHKKGDLPVIRARQINRGIPIAINKSGTLGLSIELAAPKSVVEEKYRQRLNVMMHTPEAEAALAENPHWMPPQHVTDELKHELRASVKKRVPFTLIVKKNDIFAQEEMAKIMEFLSDPDAEKNAVATWVETKVPQDTFRPCYASLVCEEIRGKLRVWCCITLEGRALPKKNRDGSLRHNFGVGKMGIDIGPQSVEIVTKDEVIADNLAERNGYSTFEKETKEKELLRAMDRSRRANNPQYYNEDGTIKKGKKRIWKKTKRYKRLQKQHKNLCRKNAINRKLALNELVLDLREKASDVITEPNNAKALQKRAKKKESATQDKTAAVANTSDSVTTVASTAADNAIVSAVANHSSDQLVHTPAPKKKKSKKRKRGAGRLKRYGRSIQNRCPGYFFRRLKEVFESTGGTFSVVSNMFCASQYDHQLDAYFKKKLSERWHIFLDGLAVQRDIYSAFLLFCANADLTAPDRELCFKYFDEFIEHAGICMQTLNRSGKTICNFGRGVA